MNKPDAIIVGSGLSGLSAAISLVDAGKKVLVLESRSVIGGRTSSWVENGMPVESGMHRFLGFYTHLPDLLKHVGVNLDKMLYWEDEVEFRLPDDEPSAVFGLAPLSKPFKTVTEALGNNDFLPPSEKVKLGVFFTAGFLQLKTESKELDRMTVSQFAKEHGLSNDTIHRLLVPLTEGLFFLRPEKYGAYNFFALFAPYIPKFAKSRVGAFMGGMTEVLMEPMVRYVEKKGSEVRTGSPVAQLIVDKKTVTGVVVGKKELHADVVIVATSLASSQALITASKLSSPQLNPMMKLASMPSVTLQLELTEPSMEIDRTTFSPGTILASYAEQSRTTFRKSKGRLSVILSSPEIYLKTTPDTLMENVLADAMRLNLNLTKQHVKRFRKITWEKDFYSYQCGTDQLRPEQGTDIPGLFLAGDYTRQKFLSTMEGAVVSGKKAAEGYLSR
jgi:15-cis-phytoene desaturase